MLTRRQGQFVFILLMCIAMSGSMSLAMSFINLGFDHSLGVFISKWLKSWVIGFVVAVPVASVVVPVVRKIVDGLTH